MNQQDKEPLLREVSLKDEKLLFDWANDPVVRQGSFNNNPISFAKHQSWFRGKRSSQNTIMWIFECSNIPCGLVRIERSNKELILNYLIAASHRGKKMASVMLRMALEKTCIELPGAKILAYTTKNNVASCRSLKKAGFQLDNTCDEKNCFIYLCV